MVILHGIFFKKHHREFQQECFLHLGEYLTEFCTHIRGVTPLNCRLFIFYNFIFLKLEKNSNLTFLINVVSYKKRGGTDVPRAYIKRKFRRSHIYVCYYSV